MEEDFSHDAITGRQPFHMMHSDDFPNMFPDTTLEISPTESVPRSDTLQITECHSEWQGPENFSVSTNDDHNSEFTKYIEDSLCHDDPSEDGHCPTTPDEAEQMGPKNLCVDREATDEQAIQSSEASSADLQQSAIPNEVPQSSKINSHSTSMTSDTIISAVSPNVGTTDVAIEISADSLEIPQLNVDTSDVINDDDKAFDFIKALKEKGMLTDLLEKIGYPTPQSTCSETKTITSVHSIADKNSLVCTEPGCTKSFLRRCELKYV